MRNDRHLILYSFLLDINESTDEEEQESPYYCIDDGFEGDEEASPRTVVFWDHR
ncbi:hypothetical protein [Bacillus weihaiensis]|uniref:hypothetical protein n=1 Tax=Bacillus weihaiensis TaxID=1547283 RepID=UPI002356BC42|nr:hypothetical protein [Bacillus weihaiensis]